MTWIELLRDVGVFGLAAWVVKVLVARGIDRAALEHRVRFSALHEHRVRVIAMTYKRLVRSEQALQHASDPSPAQDEIRLRLDLFFREATGFFEYFASNRIWLSPELCAHVDGFWQAMREAGFAVVDSLSPTERGSRSECRRVMRERCDPLKSAIEGEFRKALGSG